LSGVGRQSREQPGEVEGRGGEGRGEGEGSGKRGEGKGRRGGFQTIYQLSRPRLQMQ